MWTMGDDFQYQYAESWFKEMDKFIHYVNKVKLPALLFAFTIVIRECLCFEKLEVLQNLIYSHG